MWGGGRTTAGSKGHAAASWDGSRGMDWNYKLPAAWQMALCFLVEALFINRQIRVRNRNAERGCRLVVKLVFAIMVINQSIKTQDQQCQWPNKPRPQTQGS